MPFRRKRTEALPAPPVRPVRTLGATVSDPVALPWLWPENARGLGSKALPSYALWPANLAIACGAGLVGSGIGLLAHSWPLRHLPTRQGRLDPLQTLDDSAAKPATNRPEPDAQRWRHLERRWNRAIQPRRSTTSAWLIGLLLLTRPGSVKECNDRINWPARPLIQLFMEALGFLDLRRVGPDRKLDPRRL